MSAYIFQLEILIIDDDPAIVDQHKFIIANREFRKKTLAFIYAWLRDANIILADREMDLLLEQGKFPTKEQIRHVLVVNPENDDPYSLCNPIVAYSASDAFQLWDTAKDQFSFGRGVCVALLDYDMPEGNGLDLTKQWRPIEGGKRNTRSSPAIIFYTGKAALLEEAINESGLGRELIDLTNSDLADAVIQKGASSEEFNQIIWKVISKFIKNKS